MALLAWEINDQASQDMDFTSPHCILRKFHKIALTPVGLCSRHWTPKTQLNLASRRLLPGSTRFSPPTFEGIFEHVGKVYHCYPGLSCPGMWWSAVMSFLVNDRWIKAGTLLHGQLWGRWIKVSDFLCSEKVKFPLDSILYIYRAVFSWGWLCWIIYFIQHSPRFTLLNCIFN